MQLLGQDKLNPHPKPTHHPHFHPHPVLLRLARTNQVLAGPGLQPLTLRRRAPLRLSPRGHGVAPRPTLGRGGVRAADWAARSGGSLGRIKSDPWNGYP